MPSKKQQISIKSQKYQGVPDLTEDEAREYLERLRWPGGIWCIECGSKEVYRLGGKSTRCGLLKCRYCKAQFSVTVETIMEDSHLPLAKWVKAFHFMASSKKGISALQLMRNLGLGSYKTAWHLAHRIRHAMASPTGNPLSGVVEVDETYVGGKPRPDHLGKPTGGDRKGRGTDKASVVAMVQRDGGAVSRHVGQVDGATLKEAIRECVSPQSVIVTDEWRAYRGIGHHFVGGHAQSGRDKWAAHC
jgi:transposase-like protein